MGLKDNWDDNAVFASDEHPKTAHRHSQTPDLSILVYFSLPQVEFDGNPTFYARIFFSQLVQLICDGFQLIVWETCGGTLWEHYGKYGRNTAQVCASDIALQTVGVTAVNCFAGGRFVFIGDL